jgi:RNA polymerase sigma-70 factor (ECF subfamily)
MKYFDEMKYEEHVANIGHFGWSIKSFLHHAVKKVEEFLTKDV